MYLTNNYVKCIIDIIIVCVLWISLFCIYYKYNFSFWDYKYYYFIFGKLLEKQQINVKMIMRFYSNYKMKSNFKFNLIISIFLPTSCWQLMTDLTRQVEGRHSNYTFHQFGLFIVTLKQQFWNFFHDAILLNSVSVLY